VKFLSVVVGQGTVVLSKHTPTGVPLAMTFLPRKVGSLAVASSALLMVGTTVLLSLQGWSHQRGPIGMRRELPALPTPDADRAAGAAAAGQVNDVDVPDGVAGERTDDVAAPPPPPEAALDNRLRRVVLCKSSLSPAADSTTAEITRGARAKAHFRPKIIFIAGIEGSGHHGMVPLIRDLGGITYIEKTDQILTNMWDPTVPIAERVRHVTSRPPSTHHSAKPPPFSSLCPLCLCARALSCSSSSSRGGDSVAGGRWRWCAGGGSVMVVGGWWSMVGDCCFCVG
jgi:hypothetical protein